jgi:hypothetical protein
MPRYLLVLAVLMALVSFPASAYPWIYSNLQVFPNTDKKYTVTLWAIAYEDASSCCEYFNQASVTSDHIVRIYSGLIWESHERTGELTGLSAYGTVQTNAMPANQTYYTEVYFRFHIPGYDGEDFMEFAQEYGSGAIDGNPELSSIDPDEGSPGDSGTMVLYGGNMHHTPVSVDASGNCGITFGTATSLGIYSMSVPYTVSQSGWGSCVISVSNAYGSSDEQVTFQTNTP